MQTLPCCNVPTYFPPPATPGKFHALASLIFPPLGCSYILADMRMDEATIAAGLLHDTVEDTEATVEEISALFGKNVADIVDGVSKISLMKFESKEEAQAENIRKMILAMAEDIRVLMVKLADRLHNIRT